MPFPLDEEEHAISHHDLVGLSHPLHGGINLVAGEGLVGVCCVEILRHTGHGHGLGVLLEHRQGFMLQSSSTCQATVTAKGGKQGKAVTIPSQLTGR